MQSKQPPPETGQATTTSDASDGPKHVDVRPRARDRVMVYFDMGSVPLNDVTLATTVTASSLVLQRSGSLREAPLEPGMGVTVLFTVDGRLYHWPMRLEEVLPSSFFLASVREPGEGERREFVRARVPMRGRMREDASTEWITTESIEDLSAAGFRVPAALPFAHGARVHVELLPQTAETPTRRRVSGRSEPIHGIARVVRSGGDMAFELVELGSSEENRVSDRVFSAREAALLERLKSASRPG